MMVSDGVKKLVALADCLGGNDADTLMEMAATMSRLVDCNMELLAKVARLEAALGPAEPVAGWREAEIDRLRENAERFDGLDPDETIGAFDGSGQWIELMTVRELRDTLKPDTGELGPNWAEKHQVEAAKIFALKPDTGEKP